MRRDWVTATCSMASVDLQQEIYPMTTSGTITRKEAPTTIFVFKPDFIFHIFHLKIKGTCVKEITLNSRMTRLNLNQVHSFHAPSYES